MAKNRIPKKFMNVVFSSCNKGDILNLLREFKPLDRDNIQIGTNLKKEKLVYSNLQLAMERGTIPLRRVEQLVRDREQNSGHHHFYYHPKSAKIKKLLSNTEGCAAALFGDEWEIYQAFEDLPKEYAWAGFHKDLGANRKEIGWTATLYGREEAERRDVTHGTDQTVIRYVTEPVKVVLVARWRHVGVLELRVPGIDPQSLIDDMHVRLWHELEPLLTRGQTKPWDLNPVRTHIVEECLDNKSSYRDVFTLGASRGRAEDGGPTTFKGATPRTSLGVAKTRAEALKAFLKEGDNFDSSIVWWLKRDGLDFIPKNGLRTVLGPTRTTAEVNEVIFSSSSRSLAPDYVLNRLRELEPNK